MNKQHKEALEAHLELLIMSLPRTKRKDHEGDITEIYRLTGLDVDKGLFLIDKDLRSVRWNSRSEAEKIAIIEAQNEKNKVYRQKRYAERKALEALTKVEKTNYKVSYRQGGSFMCTIQEAAKFVNISVNALRIRMTKAKATKKAVAFVIDNEVLTIKKMD